MPALLQASMSSVPAGAVNFFPSTIRVTSGILFYAYTGNCSIFPVFSNGHGLPSR